MCVYWNLYSFLGCNAAADIHVYLVLQDQNVTTRQTPTK